MTRKSGCGSLVKDHPAFSDRERGEEVRRWLAKYQELKEAIGTICELNHDLLRPKRAAPKPRKKT
jgi:hypothetical protein